jgi:hypothetical protein
MLPKAGIEMMPVGVCGRAGDHDLRHVGRRRIIHGARRRCWHRAEFFADGIVEEIITALSKAHWF